MVEGTVGRRTISRGPQLLMRPIKNLDTCPASDCATVEYPPVSFSTNRRLDEPERSPGVCQEEPSQTVGPAIFRYPRPAASRFLPDHRTLRGLFPGWLRHGWIQHPRMGGDQ